MYVCICNGHRDSDIRAVAETGLRCARSIYAQLGKPARCGRCLDTAAKVIQEVQARSANEDVRADVAPEAAR